MLDDTSEGDVISSIETIDGNSVQETTCAKIPGFLNRFKNKDGDDRRVSRVFVGFRRWRRTKGKVKFEKHRLEQNSAITVDMKMAAEWENSVRRHGKLRLKRARKCGKTSENDRIEGEGLPMRSRIKTRFAKIIRRRRWRSTASKSFNSMMCSHSRRSVNLKKRHFDVFMRPLASLKGRKVRKAASYFSGCNEKMRNSCTAKKQAVEKCRRWLDEQSPPSGSRPKFDNPSWFRVEASTTPKTAKFKQKLLRVFGKFKKPGVIEGSSIAKKLSSGDTGALDVIEDFMEELSTSRSSQLDDVFAVSNEGDDDSELSLIVITQAKPTLKPYFRENICQRTNYDRSSSNVLVPNSTAAHQSFMG